MNTFSEELRKERIAKNISLSEISARTRISVKFLEAIEQGAFDVLPQTYVRAFIQEYADQVGLSPAEVLKKYEIMVAGKYADAGTPITGSGWSATSMPAVTEAAPPPPQRPRNGEQRYLRYVIPAAIVVVVVAAALIIFNMEGGSPPPVRETPFNDVVEQQEHLQARAVAVDSPVVTTPAPVDSVIVHAVTSDSVWVNIARDGGPAESAILPPHATRVWKARERLVVTLGNAGGISFTVNGKNLGTLGPRGAVLRNIRLTHIGLEHPGTR